MIRIPPPWKGERAEEIWALYHYLLYQTLPFEPGDYLPRDSTGAYYYKDGDHTKEKIYPASRSFKLSSDGEKILSAASQPAPSTLEETIQWASPELHDYLYENHAVQREHLIELLTTQTDEKTVRAKKLEFQTNPALEKLLLTEVFNYSAFSAKSRFPELVRMMGVEVCPYCNRSFTTTAKIRKGEYHRQNQVDHYRAKSKYPWFALTLPNFIPACGNCNLRKSDTDDCVLYPYTEGFDDKYHFRTKLVSGLGYLTGADSDPEEFEVEIVPYPSAALDCDPDYEKRVKTSIDKFGLDVLYRESHNAYVCNIYEQRYIFDDAYLDSLINSFPDLFQSREEARSLLYMRRYDGDSLGASPLARLTHDIDEEISRLHDALNMRR